MRRYNEQAMKRSLTSLFLTAFVLTCVALWFAACAAHFGPGYLVEKQEIQVSFAPQPTPMVRVAAKFDLKNTGTQELSLLDVRLPGRRFHTVDLAISWDGAALIPNISPENPRDVQLRFPQTWSKGTSHTLQFSYGISSIDAGR